MRKFLILLCLMGICLYAISQSQWIMFTDPHPSGPIVTLQSSSNQQVTFSVVIPGMYMETLVVGPETYQRISISKAGSWGDSGFPELPSLSKLIAVPECDSIIVSYLVTDSIILDSYTVYPRPEIVYDSLSGTFIEQFIKNDSVYQLDRFMPEIDYEILSEGYLRNQRIAKVAAYPIKYNPGTKQLVVYTQLEVSLTFQDPQDDINVENGLFNNICSNTLLNFNMEDRSLPPFPVLPPGDIEWLAITDTSQAVTIDADYLIIADDQFFEPHSPALQIFANHRSDFNGFKVTIVGAQDIVNTGFYFDPNHSEFINEQRIRSFIKRVYEGEHAQHTYDGRVAFVLLAGDAIANTGNEGVPASLDPDPTGVLDSLQQLVWHSDNDYYYSCVTQNPINNKYDLIGDIFIGRFCADNETELFNIVNKTRKYENEIWSGISNGNWRKRNTLAYGLAIDDEHRTYFCDFLKDRLEELYPSEYQTSIVDGTNNQQWNYDYVTLLNDSGSNLVIDYGHGEETVWLREHSNSPSVGALTLDYKMNNLHNPGQWPFVIANACITGRYTNNLMPDCIAEKVTVFSSDSGYVASLASFQNVGINHYSDPGSFPKYIYETVPYALYHNLSSLLGECVLEGRLLCDPGIFPSNFQWNLFGDPALNLMAPGYELSHDVELSGINIISTPVKVKENAILKLTDNAEIWFEENGSLTIENGSKLVLCHGTSIKGKSLTNKIIVQGIIEGNYEGPNPPSPNPLDNVSFTALDGHSWSGLEFDNPGLNVKVENCTLSDCKILGELNSLYISSSTTLVNSEVSLINSSLTVEDCNFSNSNIILTNHNQNTIFANLSGTDFQFSSADAIIRMEHIPSFSIQNCTIYDDHGTGIDLYYSGNGNNENLIKDCTIENSGSSQDLSWGIKVYNSFADIENNYITKNRYGVASFNQSQVRLQGNPAASAISETQQIVENYQNQVWASDNSFPFYFHYNIVQNTPPCSTYLVYYSYDTPLPPPIESTFNVKCNCFDDDTPIPQLYPIGWYVEDSWCNFPPCSYSDQGSGEYEAAVASMEAGDYTAAETQFKNVIETYPGTTFCRESVKKLVPLENLSDQDFIGLKSYFDTTSALHEDSLTY